jgi:hypothetical protein
MGQKLVGDLDWPVEVNEQSLLAVLKRWEDHVKEEGAV